MFAIVKIHTGEKYGAWFIGREVHTVGLVVSKIRVEEAKGQTPTGENHKETDLGSGLQSLRSLKSGCRA